MTHHSFYATLFVQRGRGSSMYKLDKSIEIEQHEGVECALGKVATQGFGMSVYSFYVDGLLIDTGSSSLAQEFQSFFHKLQVEQVALTHAHEDHSGNAAWIQQQKDVPIYVHHESVTACAADGNYPLYRQVLWGQRPAFNAQPFGDTLETKTGTWDIIATPGHTTDHLSFYHRATGAMFTGDLYIQTKTKVVLEEENIVHTLASLKKLLHYDFDKVYCCHAGFLANGRAKIIEKIAYLEELQGEIRKLYNEGYSVEAITKAIFRRDYPITKVSGEQWSSKHIITAFTKQFMQES